jgi:hypothetical protein
MFRLLLLIAALGLMSFAVQAQDASAASSGDAPADDAPAVAADELEARREATRHLLEILNVDEQFERTIDQTVSMADGMIDQDADLDEAGREKARKIARAGMEASMNRLSWERLGPIIVEIYAEVFTVEEITGMTDFFESPIGQSFIEKQPQLTAATFRRIGKLVQDEMPIIQAEVQAAIKAAEADSAAEETP